MFSLEHIDPQNSKHVCGLCNEFNEVLADLSYNKRKQNRFVPYRVCGHPAPVTFGDVGEFLVSGEWVVCEFGGETWWNEANSLGCGSSDGGKAPASKKQKRAASRTGLRHVESGHLAALRTPENQRKAGKAAAKALHSQKWRCLVTGKTTTPGALTLFQRARNIDVSLRERIH